MPTNNKDIVETKVTKDFNGNPIISVYKNDNIIHKTTENSDAIWEYDAEGRQLRFEKTTTISTPYSEDEVEVYWIEYSYTQPHTGYSFRSYINSRGHYDIHHTDKDGNDVYTSKSNYIKIITIFSKTEKLIHYEDTDGNWWSLDKFPNTTCPFI